MAVRATLQKNDVVVYKKQLARFLGWGFCFPNYKKIQIEILSSKETLALYRQEVRRMHMLYFNESDSKVHTKWPRTGPNKNPLKGKEKMMITGAVWTILKNKNRRSI